MTVRPYADDDREDRYNELVDAVNAGGGGSVGTLTQDITSNGYTVASTNVRSAASFGVVADARMLTGISVTGTAMTSAADMFVSSDAGKTVGLLSSNGSGMIGEATILIYTSARAVTLATSITTSSSKAAILGTNDRAAWQSAFTWAYGLAGGGVVTFSGSAISLIAGPQVTANVAGAGPGGFTYSGQLLVAALPVSSPMGLLEIRGDVPPVGLAITGWSERPNATGLVLFFTANTGNAIDSIPHPANTDAGLGVYTFAQLNLTRVTTRMASGSVAASVNLAGAACAYLREWSADTHDITHIPSSPAYDALTYTALHLPTGQNWGVATVRDSSVTGYGRAISFSDHAILDGVFIDGNGSALSPGNVPGYARTTTHGGYFHKVTVQRCDRVIDPISFMGQEIYGSIDVEPPYQYFINDTSVQVFGKLNVGGASYSHPEGLCVKYLSPLLKIESSYWPGDGSKDSPVTDSMLRNTGISPEPFGLSGSNHAIYASFIEATSTGARLTGTGFQIFNGPTWPSRKISFTLKTSSTAARTWFGAQVRAQTISNGLNVIFSNNAGGTGILLGKTSSFTSLATAAYTFAANTEYAIDVLVQQSAQISSYVTVTVLVNGVVGLTYTLTAAEAAAYTAATGYDGIAGLNGMAGDDGGSRIKDFSVTRAEDLPYSRAGTATLVGGTVDITDTKITANSIVRRSRLAAGGTLGHLSVALTATTKFTINSSSASDTSTVYYEVVRY